MLLKYLGKLSVKLFISWWTEVPVMQVRYCEMAFLASINFPQIMNKWTNNIPICFKCISSYHADHIILANDTIYLALFIRRLKRHFVDDDIYFMYAQLDSLHSEGIGPTCTRMHASTSKFIYYLNMLKCYQIWIWNKLWYWHWCVIIKIQWQPFLAIMHNLLFFISGTEFYLYRLSFMGPCRYFPEPLDIEMVVS